MRLSNELNEALNFQVLHEYRNMHIYKMIQAYFEDLQLVNIAEYFAKQAAHENDHANMFFDYINMRTGGEVLLLKNLDVAFDFSNLNSIMDIYVRVEEETTASIEEIYGLALNQKSFMDLGFLEEMLNEQVEEEDSANTFATKIRAVKDIVLFDAMMGDNHVYKKWSKRIRKWVF